MFVYWFLVRPDWSHLFYELQTNIIDELLAPCLNWHCSESSQRTLHYPKVQSLPQTMHWSWCKVHSTTIPLISPLLTILKIQSQLVFPVTSSVWLTHKLFTWNVPWHLKHGLIGQASPRIDQMVSVLYFPNLNREYSWPIVSDDFWDRFVEVFYIVGVDNPGFLEEKLRTFSQWFWVQPTNFPCTVNCPLITCMQHYLGNWGWVIHLIFWWFWSAFLTYSPCHEKV